MKQALVITPEGKVSQIDIATDSLGKLQGAVGGWVQAVSLLDNKRTLWCNEEGKLLGLEHNPAAQRLLYEVYGAGIDYIAGTVVITGGTDSRGETVGLTDAQVAQTKATITAVALSN